MPKNLYFRALKFTETKITGTCTVTGCSVHRNLHL